MRTTRPKRAGENQLTGSNDRSGSLSGSNKQGGTSSTIADKAKHGGGAFKDNHDDDEFSEGEDDDFDLGGSSDIEIDFGEGEGEHNQPEFEDNDF